MIALVMVLAGGLVQTMSASAVPAGSEATVRLQAAQESQPPSGGTVWGLPALYSQERPSKRASALVGEAPCGKARRIAAASRDGRMLSSAIACGGGGDRRRQSALTSFRKIGGILTSPGIRMSTWENAKPKKNK